MHHLKIHPGPKQLHLCLTGGWFSSYNVGDQAILLGITDAFAQLDNPRFSVITAKPAKVQSQYGLPAFAPKKTPFKLLSNLLSADALIFTGGTPFYDARPHMTYYAALARIAHARRIPVIVFGISLRSLHDRYCQATMRGIAHWATFLGAREDRTLEAFKQLAPGSDKVQLVPDLAIQMKPASPEQAAALLKSEGVGLSARNISICMRDFRADEAFQKHHYSRGYDGASLDRYHSALRAVAEYAVRDKNCNVVFCPMHTVAPDDDRRIATEVRDAISDPAIRSRVTVLQKQYGPREMKAMLGLMQANIGIRFHSLVLATSMHVPSIAVAYAHKNQAFMDYIGQSQFGSDLATVDAAHVIEQLDQVLAWRNQIASSLKLRFQEIDSMFAKQMLRLRDSICGRSMDDTHKQHHRNGSPHVSNRMGRTA